MSHFLYFSTLLYTRQEVLDRESFLQALLALSVITLTILLVAYTIASNTNPDSFQTMASALSYNFLVVAASLHAILVMLNITRKRLNYLRCNPFYILGIFLPFIKVLFLGLLLIDLEPGKI